MNKEIARYRRILKRNLHCGRAKRRTLLDQFEYSLLCFLEDCPSPSYTQLTDAFGPPEDMVCVLMENVSDEERERYRKGRVLLKVLICAAVALFVMFTVYVFLFKELSVVVIYDELMPVQTVIGLRGYWI